MPFYEIQCGKHELTGEARNVGVLWRWGTKKETTGFSLLARFREMRKATANRKHRAGWGPWQYINPDSLDRFGLKD